MGKREQRQHAIREILRTEKVRTQQELTELLRERGFDCIQSTVSRDISEMGLCKGVDKCYALPSDILLKRLLSDMLINVRAAGNMVVVRTVDGGAAGVAGVLDKAEFEGILGTVAGDDTIFIVAETPEKARDTENALKVFQKK